MSTRNSSITRVQLNQWLLNIFSVFQSPLTQTSSHRRTTRRTLVSSTPLTAFCRQPNSSRQRSLPLNSLSKTLRLVSSKVSSSNSAGVVGLKIKREKPTQSQCLSFKQVTENILLYMTQAAEGVRVARRFAGKRRQHVTLGHLPN